MAIAIPASLSLQAIFLLVLGLTLRALYRRWTLFVHYRRFGRQHSCAEPPLARTWLPWGLERYFTLLTSKEDLLDEFISPQFYRYGSTYKFNGLLGEQIVNTVDPENIQAILALQFKDFEIGQQRRIVSRALIGDTGFLTTDGAAWEHSRAMIRPQFARDQINDLSMMERHVEAMLGAMPVVSSGWTAGVDLSKFFFRLTLDVSTEFLFGISVDSQQASLLDAEAEAALTEATLLAAEKGDRVGADRIGFADAFTTSQAYLAYRFRLGGLYWLMDSFRFRDACKLIHRFVDHFVDAAIVRGRAGLEEKAAREDGKKEKYVLLDHLAATTQDREDLRSQILHVLLAGRDTTASLMSWTMALLATHPQVFARLRSEILQAFGPEGSSEISFAQLKSLRYLQWVLQETLRLYPSLPGNHRNAVRDTVLPRGGGPDGKDPIVIRKGQKVVYYVYVMHRRPDIWGPDANQFRPERWDGLRPSWAYLPFNGGPRICLGQQFALTEAGYVLTRLLQRFERIECVNPDGLFKKKLNLTIAPSNGVKLRLYRTPDPSRGPHPL